MNRSELQRVPVELRCFIREMVYAGCEGALRAITAHEKRVGVILVGDGKRRAARDSFRGELWRVMNDGRQPANEFMIDKNGEQVMTLEGMVSLTLMAIGFPFKPAAGDPVAAEVFALCSHYLDQWEMEVPRKPLE